MRTFILVDPGWDYAVITNPKEMEEAMLFNDSVPAEKAAEIAVASQNITHDRIARAEWVRRPNGSLEFLDVITELSEHPISMRFHVMYTKEVQ
jgi:hypothetical protein